MPARARKTPARKPAADQGLVLDRAAAKTATAGLVEDREPLFTIGGVTYTIPKTVPVSWSLQTFNVAVNQGESAALAFAASKALTTEAWEALQACDTLTRDDLSTVLNAIMDRVLPEGLAVPKA
ncbi:hypothetical protein [Amycolatopsis sp. H20-H5]|uniref:hypothetical protein n=1 Tax=Amycolatopsis sp. H20-H5 TaxID=3046309 RepID=UPI002DBD7FA8|nr:hypothetical protein [Amycolatopsis sp. H20-H5]MEC3974736.1 hypothetical protein [Amycolatopsis sp. H20-H5]